MQENKSLVQEALIQMKNVEEAIAENAKGILASTMKEEINQLVKESLSEQDDEDGFEIDADTESPELDVDADNSDDMDMDLDTDVDMDMDSDESPIDLTDSSDEEILKVFKAMGEDDGIIVKKDGNDIHLTDTDADTEYIVKLGESEDKSKNKKMRIKEDMDSNFDDSEDDGQNGDMTTDQVIDSIFNSGGNSSLEEDDDESEEDEQVMYEIEFDESEEEDLDESDEEDLDESDEEDLDESDEEDLDESEEEDLDESDEEDLDESDEEDLDESYSPKKSKKSTVKPKGVGIGKGPKFTYKAKASGGFKEDKKEGPKTMGTGKAKFEFKKGANMEGKSKVIKKAETKEAARTLGMGSNFREGGLPKPRAHSKFNINIKESLESEVTMLRGKNEEYRKALNVFRVKLNEVAIFNSNLAYATRLFTEHSTTKKEKINILRRFDDVETLKESKSLYKSIKDELSKVDTKPITESVETKLNKTVSSGSSSTLIESKTYENPQFVRMKDLMGKLG